MASGAFNNIAFIIGLLNLIGIMVVIVLPFWRVNSVVASEPNMQMIRYREGLWLRCTSIQDNYFNCDMYDTSIIGLAAYLNAFRALMIIAMIFSVVGVVCSALGMECATALEDDSRQKRWVVISGGVLHIVAGVLTGICVSWYAAEVVREYNTTYYVNQKIRFTLGVCLYIGWGAMLLSLVSGALMACCTCFDKHVESEGYSYPPTKAQEKLSMPPVPSTPIYRPSPTMGYDQKHNHPSSPYTHHHSSRHSRHLYDDNRSHHGSHRSISSHHSNHHYRDSPKSSRQDSEVVRSSGFV